MTSATDYHTAHKVQHMTDYGNSMLVHLTKSNNTSTEHTVWLQTIRWLDSVPVVSMTTTHTWVSWWVIGWARCPSSWSQPEESLIGPDSVFIHPLSNFWGKEMRVLTQAICHMNAADCKKVCSAKVAVFILQRLALLLWFTMLQVFSNCAAFFQCLVKRLLLFLWRRLLLSLGCLNLSVCFNHLQQIGSIQH